MVRTPTTLPHFRIPKELFESVDKAAKHSQVAGLVKKSLDKIKNPPPKPKR